jgi:hypothetical protein
MFYKEEVTRWFFFVSVQGEVRRIKTIYTFAMYVNG